MTKTDIENCATLLEKIKDLHAKRAEVQRAKRFALDEIQRWSWKAAELSTTLAAYELIA